MRASFAALHESAFGTKRTSPDDLLFVRFWGEADLHCQPALIGALRFRKRAPAAGIGEATKKGAAA